MAAADSVQTTGSGLASKISRPYAQTVAPNQMVAGFEVMAILDRNCGNG